MSRHNYKNIKECFKSDINVPPSTLYLQEMTPKDLIVKKTRANYPNTLNPKVWGPGLWLFLHISSVNYVPDPEQIIRTTNFIKNLPYMLPCFSCSQHAKNYIAAKESELPVICSSRKNLFEFYVDFHNYVNNRLNKRLFSYEEAWKMYSGGAEILSFSY